jgi:LysR family transcriptional regulator, glycine cleavage system transcriptional activator
VRNPTQFAWFVSYGGIPRFDQDSVHPPINSRPALSKTTSSNGVTGSARTSLRLQRRLPPLNAVCAFEAAARLGGFNAAGAELNVSANAVGRLVKLLEDWLGVALFRRLPRGVVVTEAGGRYLAGVGTLLDQLAEATADVQRLETSNVLKVSALPSMVSRWLIPRLSRLTERHPELDVRVIATNAMADFAREEVDIAIRVGRGCYEGTRSDLLMHSDIFPVCSPVLLSSGPPLKEPADLVQHCLLYDDCGGIPCLPERITWPRWLAAVGVTNVDSDRGLHFSYMHMALQAATAGQGVALVSSGLIGDDLTSGRLVRPFGDLAVRSPYSFFIVCAETTVDCEKVVLFRDWALSEAARGG